MDLLEYQGKELFARYGVAQLPGGAARDVRTAVAVADEVGYPCVMKAQVKIGGRGKAGGIKIASDAEEARQYAGDILGMDIRGFTVHEIWVQLASEIEDEYYGAVVFDRSAKKPLVMLSTRGGVDIEAVADEDPDAIATLHVDPLVGFKPYHGRRLAFEAGVDADVVAGVAQLLGLLYAAFVGEEATLVEVNPIAITPPGADGRRTVVALDAKVSLDDNALFRHPQNAALTDPSDVDEQEQMAAARGLTYVKLDGDIGIFGNCAGPVSRTLAPVTQAGGAPANFLDAGGGAQADSIVAACEVILSDPKVRAVLFNVFGGITRCDEVARGLIEAVRILSPAVPFVVRLDGTNDVVARALLADAALPGVFAEATMDGAAARVVELAAAQATA